MHKELLLMSITDAGKALMAVEHEPIGSTEEQLTDLLVSIMHYADHKNINWSKLNYVATTAYVVERQYTPEEFEILNRRK